MRRVIFPILFGLVGCAVLISLGVWQVQRLAWKQDVLTRIDARIHDVPAPVPATPDEERDEYQPVEVTGIIGGAELHVLHAQSGTSPAYRLIVPLDLGSRRVMADLGTIPGTARDTMRQAGPITITGNLHWPDEVSSWTPAPDGQLWFARDVEPMAAALQTEPVLIVARSHNRPDLATSPVPVDSSGIPNDHLGYAITWFGLAFVWVLMSLLLIRRTLRNAR